MNSGSEKNQNDETKDDDDKEYLTEEELAQRLRVSPRTLQAWRQSGYQELVYSKIGRKVVYHKTDYLAYEQSRRRKSTSEY